MLHGGEWLAKKYASFAQPKATQTLDTTLVTLASRLQDAGNQEGRPGPPLPPLPDRKAAILTLRGLARDHPAEVGTKALDAVLESLCRDASLDDDLARAIVELCLTICEDGAHIHPSAGAQFSVGKEQRDQTYAAHNVERFLTTPNPLHALLPLLSPKRSFYTRFSSLQLLSVLLRIRPDRVQEHILTSPGGCGIILECLGEGTGSSAEIVRNEALLLLPQLVASNADIQKLVAFEGAFEKLIDVVAIEGRIEGGVVVQDALEALVALLKYNVSNQNYFRETLSVPLLAPLLFYPPPPTNESPEAVEEYTMQLEAFAFQQWYPPPPPVEDTNNHDRNAPTTASAAAVAPPLSPSPQTELDEQKVINASLVLEVSTLLLEGQGDSRRLNQNALLSCGFTRCLLDLSLGSTAPVPLRTQALHVLANLLRSNRSNQDLLNTMLVSPIILLGSASRSTNPVGGEEGLNYSRLPPRSAILELLGAVLNGAPTATAASDALAYRCSALGCFDAFVNDNLDARLTNLRSMALAPDGIDGDGHVSAAGRLLLESLTKFPFSPTRSAAETSSFDAYRSLLGSLLFASLIKGSETAKEEARSILFGADGKAIGRVNLDEIAAGTTKPGSADGDDDGNSLLQLLLGNLTIALREHADATRRERAAGNKQTIAEVHGKSGSSKDWTRIQIGYLIVIITWLWESRPAVEDLLKESSNLQVLIQPVSQAGNMTDPIVSGLCAAALGIAYEFGPAASSNGGTSAEDDDLVVTRATMYPIFQSRIGPDQFAARLTRLRDDHRFKATGPDVLERMGHGIRHNQRQETKTFAEELDGLWFDWPFVDFIKSNYVQIQKSILIEPNTTAASQASQTTELLDAKRQLEYYKEMHAKSEEAAQHLMQELDEVREASQSERETLVQALQAAKTEIERLHEEIQSMEQVREQDDRSRQAEINSVREQLDVVQRDLQVVYQAKEEAEELSRGWQAELQRARDHLAEMNDRVKAAENEAKEANERAATAAASHEATNGNASMLVHNDDEEGERGSRAALEQELEDLLVLLDELSTKRKRDKRLMQGKGMDVSEDEEDEDEVDLS